MVLYGVGVFLVVLLIYLVWAHRYRTSFQRLGPMASRKYSNLMGVDARIKGMTKIPEGHRFEFDVGGERQFHTFKLVTDPSKCVTEKKLISVDPPRSEITGADCLLV